MVAAVHGRSMAGQVSIRKGVCVDFKTKTNTISQDHALRGTVRDGRRRARTHGAAHADALPQPVAHPRAALHQLGRQTPIPHARPRRRVR